MLQLQIETIAACNARCVFCTYPTMRRARGRMTDEVYSKVLTDAVDLSMFIGRIYLQGLGEPLMDKAIAERVFLARQVLPQVPVSLYTNGSGLDAATIAQLAGAGLSELVVSLTGTTKEQREGAMGLSDFDEVVRWTDHARRLIPTRVKLILSRDLIEDPNLDTERFRERWGSDAMITYEGNWAGELTKFRGAPHKEACHRAMEQLMVLWNGDVALCCFDGEGEMTFGNVKDQTLREIWESPERTRVRELHRAGRRAEVPLCKGCTGI